jgi:hypothetical protein
VKQLLWESYIKFCLYYLLNSYSLSVRRKSGTKTTFCAVSQNCTKLLLYVYTTVCTLVLSKRRPCSLCPVHGINVGINYLCYFYARLGLVRCTSLYGDPTRRSNVYWFRNAASNWVTAGLELQCTYKLTDGKLFLSLLLQGSVLASNPRHWVHTTLP